MLSMTKTAFVAVGALAAVAGAQQINPQDITTFPNCAQWCVKSMQQSNKTQELGCSDSDKACLCRNPNWSYGVRDCSTEFCGDGTTGEAALRFAFDYCAKEGVQLSTVLSPGAINATGAPAAGGVVISTFTTTMITGSSTLTSTGTTTVSRTGSGPVNPSATASQVISTITAGGSTFVSTIVGSASNAVSTIVSDGSTILSTMTDAVGSVTSNVGTAVSSVVSGTNSPTTTAAEGFAAQMTAAPAGILAVAGVAAFLL